MIKKLYEALNKEAMPLCLKNSILLAYSYKNKELRLRLAVPCCSNELLYQEYDMGDKYYIIDMIAKNTLEPSILHRDEKIVNRLIYGIYKFSSYNLILNSTGYKYNELEFKANNIEWIPVSIISRKQLNSYEQW